MENTDIFYKTAKFIQQCKRLHKKYKHIKREDTIKGDIRHDNITRPAQIWPPTPRMQRRKVDLTRCGCGESPLFSTGQRMLIPAPHLPPKEFGGGGRYIEAWADQ